MEGVCHGASVEGEVRKGKEKEVERASKVVISATVAVEH